MRAIDIAWDTDGDADVLAELPKEVSLPDGLDFDDIGDWLSDEYGFCHEGFRLAPDAPAFEIDADAGWLMPEGYSVRAFYLGNANNLKDVCRLLYDEDVPLQAAAMAGAKYPATALFLVSDTGREGRCLGEQQALMDKWHAMYKSMLRDMSARAYGGKGGRHG